MAIYFPPDSEIVRRQWRALREFLDSVGMSEEVEGWNAQEKTEPDGFRYFEITVYPKRRPPTVAIINGALVIPMPEDSQLGVYDDDDDDDDDE